MRKMRKMRKRNRRKRRHFLTKNVKKTRRRRYRRKGERRTRKDVRLDACGFRAWQFDGDAVLARNWIGCCWDVEHIREGGREKG